MYDDEESTRNELEDESDAVNNVETAQPNVIVPQHYYAANAPLIAGYAPPLAAVPQVNGHEDSLKNISTQTNNVLAAPPMQVTQQVIVPMAPVVDHVVIPEAMPIAAEIKETYVPEPIVEMTTVIESKEVERQEIIEKVRSE